LTYFQTKKPSTRSTLEKWIVIVTAISGKQLDDSAVCKYSEKYNIVERDSRLGVADSRGALSKVNIMIMTDDR